MTSRRRPSTRNDQGVVAIELVVIMPFIIALIVCIIALAGLFGTKSMVVGAARDGARAFSLRPEVTQYDPNTTDGIAVTLAATSSACPKFSDEAYQQEPPPRVTAKAEKTYHLSIPFVLTKDVTVTEEATMPCG